MSLEFVDIAFSYGSKPVLTGVSFDAAAGEITCLLGTSGCGKSTLLRIAAGVLPVQTGRVLLDSTLIATATASPPPEARDIGLVFQEGALFPHLSVTENIGFGIPKDQHRQKRIDDVLSLLGLQDFAERFPGMLSGGQQQRVALGRALAPAPRVLLLDEPFANVDVILRRALREQTRQILKARDAIVVMVTHDPEEAMEIADRIVILDEGTIIQNGSAAEIFDEPASVAVGAMFGNSQIVQGERVSGGILTDFGHWPATSLKADAPSAEQLDLIVRPEALFIDADRSASSSLSDLTPLRVTDVKVIGPRQFVTILGKRDQPLKLEVDRETSIAKGDEVVVRPKPGSLHAFPAKT